MKKKRAIKIKNLVCKSCKDVVGHAQGQYITKKAKTVDQRNIAFTKYCRFCKTHTKFI